MIHVILLDNRYSFNKRESDFLGEAQWQWLDQALKRGKSRGSHFTILVSGIQVIPEKLIDAVETYRWRSRKQLYDVLAANEMAGVIVLSGDVHMT